MHVQAGGGECPIEAPGHCQSVWWMAEWGTGLVASGCERLRSQSAPGVQCCTMFVVSSIKVSAESDTCRELLGIARDCGNCSLARCLSGAMAHAAVDHGVDEARYLGCRILLEGGRSPSLLKDKYCPGRQGRERRVPGAWLDRPSPATRAALEHLCGPPKQRGG